jgi:DNA-binding XRE family transcriptional regulator
MPAADHAPDQAGGGSGRRSVFPGFTDLGSGRRAVVAGLVSQRQRLGLSQTVVATRMQTSQSAVARLESGDTDPLLSTLQRYAAALRCDLNVQLAPARPEPAKGGTP